MSSNLRAASRERDWPAVGGLARPRLVLLALLATITSCAPISRHTRAEPAVPDQWASPTDADASAQADSAELAAWWTTFGDPLLSAFVDEALVANHDQRAAVARLREARARVTVARGARDPSVSASASAGVSDSTTGVGGPDLRFGTGLDASWELDVFGALGSTIDAAEYDAAASQAGVYGTRVSIAAEVARNYVEARRAQQRLVVAQENLRALEELLELAEFREQSGVSGAQEVLQVRSNLEQARAQLPSLSATVELHGFALDVLLGAAPGASSQRREAPRPVPAVPPTIVHGIPADVLRQRPDVQAAEWSARAALARVEVADAARYPSFRLSGSVGLEALTRIGVGSGVGATYSLLAGVTAPLFNGGRLRAQVEQQDAAAEQAWISYESAVLGAIVDVENALVALEDARQRVALLGAVLADTVESAVLATAGYQAGLTDLTAVLDAERSRLTVTDNVANAEADVVLGVVQLYRALGGGWSAEPNDADASVENE